MSIKAGAQARIYSMARPSVLGMMAVHGFLLGIPYSMINTYCLSDSPGYKGPVKKDIFVVVAVLT
jgi:hypothetical protein